jgi:adenylate cyclase class 2
MVPHSSKEIELKFPLLEIGGLVERLDSVAKRIRFKESQKDTYYIPPHRNFLEAKPVSEWLRLRETAKGASLNYKNWHNHQGAKAISCDEFETMVENTEAIRFILGSLDFREIAVVEKTRNSWLYKDAEISIDDVRELGIFLELELKTGHSGTKDAKERLMVILKEIGAQVGEQDFEGYPFRLLAKKASQE